MALAAPLRLVPTPPAQDLQTTLVSLVGRARAIDLRPYEPLSRAVIAEELAPRVGRVLAEAVRVADELLEARGRSVASLGTHAARADRAFLGRLELGQRLARLTRAVARGDAQELLDACDSGLRRVRKVLTALEADVAAERGGAARLDARRELDAALSVRQAGARLRALVSTNEAPLDDELDRRLRLASTVLTILHGWEAWAHLRSVDRVALDGLRGRVLHWLAGDQAPEAGHALFDELARALARLALVSHRAEVFEHDAALVERAIDVARERADADAAMPLRLLGELEGLEGISEQVDALLGSNARSRARAWLPVLRRLESCLRPTTPPPRPDALLGAPR